jgi:hypothetical protein
VLPPLVNATLTKIEGGGFVDDYRDGEGADTTKWTGESGCYVEEKVGLQRGLDANRTTRGREDIVHATKVMLDGRLPEPVTGDHITFEWNGGSARREVWDVESELFAAARLFTTVWLEPV